MSGLAHPVLPLLKGMGRAAREGVLDQLTRRPLEERIREGAHSGSDVIYAIDHAVETGLVELLEQHAADLGGILLLAEGIGEEERLAFPRGFHATDCAWRLLVDPIDGTRPIMMDKRSAWFLAGAAPNLGENTRLSDIACAVICELPTTRAAVADDFAAVRGKGVEATRSFLTASIPPVTWTPTPWAGPSLRGGFVQLVRFAPPGRDELARIEEDLLSALFPDAAPGEIICFEDQYASTGGQLVELLCGRDRFTADLRAALFASPHFAGRRKGHACHPYDLAGALVAQEAGVLLTRADGSPFDGPLDTRSDMDWIGYPNASIRGEVETTLLRLLRERQWIR